MRLLCSILIAGLLAGCVGDLAPPYGEWRFGRSGGYRVTQEAPNRLQVRAVSTGFHEAGFAYDMAFYRAAILLKATGFPYMQVVDYRGIAMDFTTGYRPRRVIAADSPERETRGNEDLTISVVGVSNPDTPIACEAEPDFRQACRNMAVDRVLAELGPRLAQSPAQTRAELEAATQPPPPQ